MPNSWYGLPQMIEGQLVIVVYLVDPLFHFSAALAGAAPRPSTVATIATTSTGLRRRATGRDRDGWDLGVDIVALQVGIDCEQIESPGWRRECPVDASIVLENDPVHP